MLRLMLLAGTTFGFLSVALGAFGAHQLEGWLEDQGRTPEAIAKALDWTKTAVSYQLPHSVMVVALLSVARIRESSQEHSGSQAAAKLASLFFLVGITLFCGGLYSMAFFDVMGHFLIVPSGGVCLMLGWLALLGYCFKN